MNSRPGAGLLDAALRGAQKLGAAAKACNLVAKVPK